MVGLPISDAAQYDEWVQWVQRRGAGRDTRAPECVVAGVPRANTRITLRDALSYHEDRRALLLDGSIAVPHFLSSYIVLAATLTAYSDKTRLDGRVSMDDALQVLAKTFAVHTSVGKPGVGRLSSSAISRVVLRACNAGTLAECSIPAIMRALLVEAAAVRTCGLDIARWLPSEFITILPATAGPFPVGVRTILLPVEHVTRAVRLVAHMTVSEYTQGNMRLRSFDLMMVTTLQCLRSGKSRRGAVEDVDADIHEATADALAASAPLSLADVEVAAQEEEEEAVVVEEGPAPINVLSLLSVAAPPRRLLGVGCQHEVIVEACASPAVPFALLHIRGEHEHHNAAEDRESMYALHPAAESMAIMHLATTRFSGTIPGNLASYVALYKSNYDADMEMQRTSGRITGTRADVANHRHVDTASPDRRVRAKHASHAAVEVSQRMTVPLPLDNEVLNPQTLMSPSQVRAFKARITKPAAAAAAADPPEDDDLDELPPHAPTVAATAPPAAAPTLPVATQMEMTGSAGTAASESAPAPTDPAISRAALSTLSGMCNRRISCFSWTLGYSRVKGMAEALANAGREGKSMWAYFISVLEDMQKQQWATVRYELSDDRKSLASLQAFVQVPQQQTWVRDLPGVSDVHIIDDTFGLFPTDIKSYVCVGIDPVTRMGLPLSYAYLLTPRQRGQGGQVGEAADTTGTFDGFKTEFMAQWARWWVDRGHPRPRVTIFDRDAASIAGFVLMSRRYLRDVGRSMALDIVARLQPLADFVTPVRERAADAYIAGLASGDLHTPESLRVAFPALQGELPTMLPESSAADVRAAIGCFAQHLVVSFVDILPGLAFRLCSILRKCWKDAELHRTHDKDAKPYDLVRAFQPWCNLRALFAESGQLDTFTRNFVLPCVLLCQWHVSRAMSNTVWQKMSGAARATEGLFKDTMANLMRVMYADSAKECGWRMHDFRYFCVLRGLPDVITYVEESWFTEAWSPLWCCYGRHVGRLGQNVTTMAENNHSLAKSRFLQVQVGRNPVHTMRTLHGVTTPSLVSTVSLVEHIEVRRAGIVAGTAPQTRTAAVKRQLPRVLKVVQRYVEDPTTIQRIHADLFVYAVKASGGSAVGEDDVLPLPPALVAWQEAQSAADADADAEVDETSASLGGTAGTVGMAVANETRETSDHDGNSTRWYVVDPSGGGSCTCPLARCAPVGADVLCKHVLAVRVVHEFVLKLKVTWSDHELQYHLGRDNMAVLRMRGLTDVGVDPRTPQEVREAAAAAGPKPPSTKLAARMDKLYTDTLEAATTLGAIAQVMVAKVARAREHGDKEESKKVLRTMRKALGLCNELRAISAPDMLQLAARRSPHFRAPRKRHGAKAKMGTRRARKAAKPSSVSAAPTSPSASAERTTSGNAKAGSKRRRSECHTENDEE